MSNNKRNKLRAVTVDNRHFKWRVTSEKVGCTLKLWGSDKQLLVEEWFPNKPNDNFDSAYLKDLIVREKL